jgi:putative transposase
MAVSFPGAHFAPASMLTGGRWYAAYPWRTRQVEERMRERGGCVEHATINRWVLKDSPPLEAAVPRQKRPVWISWRRDEPDIRVKGEWRSLDRAVDKDGPTIDCLLTAPGDERAARRCLTQALRRHGVPNTITLAGSAAKAAAITRDNEASGPPLLLRQGTYLNKMVAQEQRGVKRVTRPRLGCTSCDAAQSTRLGLELRHRLRKGPLARGADRGLTPAEPFDARASSSRHQQGPRTSHPSHTKICDRALSIDGQENFIEMPLVTRFGTSAT